MTNRLRAALPRKDVTRTSPWYSLNTLLNAFEYGF
jgi:hypothetical protein